MPFVLQLGGTNYSVNLKDVTLNPGGDGITGSATLILDVLAGGLTITDMMEVKLWQTFNAAGAGIAPKGRLFGGHINLRETGNVGNTKTWRLGCWDYNIALAKTVRDYSWAGSQRPIVLTAGHFSAQIISLFSQLQNNGGSAPPVQIDVSNYVVDFYASMPAVTYPGGHKAAWYVQQLCLKAKALVPATSPHFYMGVGTTFGVGDTFGNAVLNVYDGAIVPSPTAVFSDNPTGGQFPCYGKFTRVLDSATLTQRIQSLFNSSTITSFNSTSQATYPNPYINHGGTGNSGYWQDELIQDSGSVNNAGAQAALDRLIAAKSYPKETVSFDTIVRVLPGDTVQVTNALEGLSLANYRVAKVRMVIEPPEVIVSTLTLGNRRLLLFDTGEEEVAIAPIEGDHVPPEPAASFGVTTNVYNWATGKSDITYAIGASPSGDVAGYYIVGTLNGSYYRADVGLTLAPLLSYNPGDVFVGWVYAYDTGGNTSGSFPAFPGSFTVTAASVPNTTPPTVTYVSQGHEAAGYWIIFSVNHATLTTITDGWGKAKSGRNGPDHLVSLIGSISRLVGTAVALPVLCKITGLALGVWNISAQVAGPNGIMSDFCTPTAVTITSVPAPAPPGSGWGSGTPDDPFAEWNPVSPAVDADFAIDTTTAADEGTASLNVTVTSNNTKTMQSFDYIVRPGEQVVLHGNVFRGTGVSTAPTASVYGQWYDATGVTQQGSNQTLFSVIPATSWPSSAYELTTTAAPAGAYILRLFCKVVGGSVISGTYHVWFSYPTVKRIVNDAQLATGIDGAKLTGGTVAFAALATAVVNAIPGGSGGQGLQLSTLDAGIAPTQTSKIFVPNAGLTDIGGGVRQMDFDAPTITPTTTVQTFSNSTAENTLVSLSPGTLNRQIALQVFHFRAFGTISNALSGHTTTIRVKVGTVASPVTVFTIAVPTLSGASTPWYVDFTFGIRNTGSSGTAWGYLVPRFNSTGTDQTSAGGTIAIDTTQNMAVKLTSQFSALSASDTISLHMASMR